MSIPIKVVPATEDHSVKFHQVHLADMSRVRYRKICEIDGREVYQDEIGKGYEISPGRTITLTDEELGDIPLPTA